MQFGWLIVFEDQELTIEQIRHIGPTFGTVFKGCSWHVDTVCQVQRLQ